MDSVKRDQGKKVAGKLAYYNPPASAVFSSHRSPEGHPSVKTSVIRFRILSEAEGSPKYRIVIDFELCFPINENFFPPMIVSTWHYKLNQARAASAGDAERRCVALN